MGDIASRYYGASGFAGSDCVVLGQRYDVDRGFQPGESECVVCTVRPAEGGSRLDIHMGTTGWYTAIWQSPERWVWVTDANGRISVTTDIFAEVDMATKWKEEMLDAALFGIWGVHDRAVFTWGERRQQGVVYQWDGKQWIELAPPGFQVHAMHGIAPDQVWACGSGGSVARWDGGRWSPVQTRNDEDIVSIFAAGADEIYACGNRGSILEGSAQGFARIGSIPDAVAGDVQAVAKWHGELWIGASRLGLWQRKGTTDQFECLKPNIDATHFDARQELVITCEEVIAGTADGAGFRGSAKNALHLTRQPYALGQF